MTKTTHTPGPWSLDEDRYVTFKNAVFAADGRKVADCGSSRLTGEVEANARLIASAPELLKFVQQVASLTFDHEQEPHYADDCIDTLQRLQEEAAAIAKAEGGAA